MAKSAKGGLGRGFGALLGDTLLGEDEQLDGVSTLPMTLIEPNADQPRRQFDPELLRELTESISMHGVISPITVRKMENGYYQIIAGERRWRAARSAGLTEIPAMVIEADDSEVMQMALIENLQRADLIVSPIKKHFGKTLGEVLNQDPRAIKWLANSYNGDPQIKAAAEFICNYSLEQASA